MPYDARGSSEPLESARTASEHMFFNRFNTSLASPGVAYKANGNESTLESAGTFFVFKYMVRRMEAVGDTSLNFWG